MYRGFRKHVWMWLAVTAVGLGLSAGSVGAQQTQMVNASGMDGHLIFPYWSTVKNANTHLAIESPLGVRPSLAKETKNVVRVMVKDTKGMAVGDFRICLMGANTWTARIIPSGDGSLLEVVAPGSCDGDVIQTTPQRERDVQPSTLNDKGMAMLDAMSGYIEAYVEPMGTLQDANVLDDEGAGPPQASDDGHARPIAGTAVLLNAMSGFASSYDATAIGCRLTNAAGDGDNGDTDEPTDVDEDGDNVADRFTPRMCSAEQVQMALHEENKDILNGRWQAVDIPAIVTSTTSVVLTFPGGNHLAYKGVNGVLAATDEDTEAPPTPAEGDDAGMAEGTDPVTLVVFDEMGGIAERNHEVMLDKAVNMCSFMPASMVPEEDDMMADEDGMMRDDADEDMDMDEPMTGTTISCNGMMVAEGLDADVGSFRIVNNAAPITLAREDDDTIVVGDGMETEGITFAAQTPVAPRGAPANGTRESRFAAVGLVMSYFMGGYGHYDTLTELRSYNYDGELEEATEPETPLTDDSERLNGL